jgi:RNA recognition motif-containing protein
MQQDLKQQVLQQIEYYFSDPNLFQDKFLVNHIKKNPEGYVDISLLLTFKKLQALSVGADLIRECVKSSNKLTLSPDETQIKRIIPFVPSSTDQVFKKSIFVSGFPTTIKNEDVMKIFSPIKVVHVRINKNKIAGRVEFKDEEDATTVLDNHSSNPYQFAGTKLFIRNYLDPEQSKAMREAKESIISKKRKTKEEKMFDVPAPLKKKKISLSHGSVLQFVVQIPSKKLKSAFMRKLFDKHGTVVHMDCPTGQLVGVNCFVRYQNPEEAEAAYTQLSSEYNGQILFTHLNDEELANYEAKVNKLLDRKNGLLQNLK